MSEDSLRRENGRYRAQTNELKRRLAKHQKYVDAFANSGIEPREGCVKELVEALKRLLDETVEALGMFDAHLTDKLGDQPAIKQARALLASLDRVQ